MSEINQDFLQRLTSLLDKGDEEFKKQNYVSAIEKYDKALESIGSQHLSQKEKEEIRDRKVNCLLKKGYAYLQEKNLDPLYNNAYESVHEVLEIDKNNTQANYLFAVIGDLRGYPDEGIPYMLKAGEANPNNSIYVHGLGILYKHAGKEKDATKYLQKAEVLSPGITRQHPDELIYLYNDVESVSKTSSLDEADEKPIQSVASIKSKQQPIKEERPAQISESVPANRKTIKYKQKSTRRLEVGLYVIGFIVTIILISSVVVAAMIGGGSGGGEVMTATTNMTALEIYDLGYQYYQGENVSQDYEKAVELYILAADKGSTPAMIALSDMYWDGVGVSQNYQTSLEWYIKAAEAGDTSIN